MNCAGFGIVVLAAGQSRRFGAPKLAAPIDGVPLIRRVALAAVASGAKVVVVTGAHRDVLEPHVADLPLERAFNADWASGMGSSIACGVGKLDATIDAAIIMLADQPLIGCPELLQLIAAHAQAAGRIIAAQFSGVLGPPCLFPRRYFAELAALRGDHGARGVLQRHIREVDPMPMPNAAADIDTPRDLVHFTSQA
jgi:CTP:molybdopterin cytidylyltransferase MocA